MVSFVKVWLPLLLSLGVNVYLLGFKLGALQTQIASIQKLSDKHSGDQNVHMPLSRKYELFVSQQVYVAQQAASADQMAQVRASLIDQGHKLDRIYERLSDPR